MLEILLQDLRYGTRTLRQNPGFAFVVILTLALGIGANTSIFTIVNAVMIEPLPFRDPDRLIVIWETNERSPEKANVVAPANYMRWTERATSFERMSAFYEWRANLTGEGAPEEVVAQRVTSNFFATMGAEPMLGRAFAAEEGARGRDQFTILGNGIWKRRFGGDPSIVGRSIRLNGRPYAVIGVMPPDVSLFLKAGSLVGKPAEIWTPLAFAEGARQPRGRFISTIARLKPGVAPAAARAEMNTIAASLAMELPQFNKGWGVRLVPLADELSGQVRPALLVLTGAVAFVLLIACANVANLFLARGAARRPEIAIRAALGAGRSRIVRQLLTESLLLALLGGAAGLLMARWSLRVLLAISPVDITRMGHVELSYALLGFTALLSFSTAVISGFIPALETARIDLQEALKDGARHAGSGVRSRWLRQAFVVAQVAAAVVLLAGAGLMLRSFANMRAVDPGFDFRNVLTVRVTLPSPAYDRPKAVQFYRQAVENIRAIPGVRAAGAISFLPLTGTGVVATGFEIVGQPAFEAGSQPVVDVRVVDNGYFNAMKVPLLTGRLFTEREMREKSDVVIVNEAMARSLGGSATGTRLMIQMSNPPVSIPSDVIGIVADSRFADVTTASRPMAYWPLPQYVMSAMTLTVRTDTDPMAMAPRVAGAIQFLDHDLPVAEVRTMEQFVAASLAQTRFSSVLLTVFGGLALLLAAIGIYGVMAYSVSQRSSEFAVRLALGAEPGGIVRMVVRHGLVLVIVGLALGVPLALILNRSVTTLLYNTSGNDPAIFTAVVMVLGGVAALASYLPARRAARTAPASALRHQ